VWSGVELEPGTEIGGYRIDRVIGRGGMGIVYLAEQRSLNRRVALKVIAPDLAVDVGFRARFVREAQLAASLEHPNIIPIHDAGEVDGVLFISMRYVLGTDLDARLDRDGRVPAAETLDIVRQAGGALDAAHTAGLVHRDVKPANILIASGEGTSPEGRIYLTDFGLTKRIDSRSRLTRTGFFLGTVAYSAPEQLQGREVDRRVDVYSLTCVLYHCLTGSLPFERDTDPAMVAAHLMDAPPSPCAARPDLPAALDDLVRRGMAKAPEDRYPTCRAMMEDLETALTGGSPKRTISAPPPAPPPPAPPRPAPEVPETRVSPAPEVPETRVSPAPAVAGSPAAERTAPGIGRAWWVLALPGALMLLGSGLVELLVGRDGRRGVVEPWDVTSALGTVAIGVVAVAGAVLARRGRDVGWGILGGVGIASTLRVVAVGVLTDWQFLDFGLVDNLLVAVGGGLCALAWLVHAGSTWRRRLPRARPALLLTVAAVALLVVPVIGAFQERSRDMLAVAGAVLTPAVLALVWPGADRPGLAIGAGAFAVGFTAPLVQFLPFTAVERVSGELVLAIPGLIGGLLLVASGLLEHRKAGSAGALQE
jgi:hypothetical protein